MADDGSYRELVQQDAENIAKALERLAARIRGIAIQFTANQDPRRDSDVIASDIVADYIHGMGAHSSLVACLLHDAKLADEK